MAAENGARVILAEDKPRFGGEESEDSKGEDKSKDEKSSDDDTKSDDKKSDGDSNPAEDSKE